MVDSGSDLSLMREDVFRKVLKLTKEIGKGELITIGSFDIDIFVTITFHVVKRDELEYTAIVGNNILQKVNFSQHKRNSLDRLQGSKVFTTLDLANGFFTDFRS